MEKVYRGGPAQTGFNPALPLAPPPEPSTGRPVTPAQELALHPRTEVEVAKTPIEGRQGTPTKPCDIASQLFARERIAKLMNHDELVKSAGAPKSFKILGFELFQRSTGYREILNKTRGYHQALDKAVVLRGSDGPRQLESLALRLKALDESAQRYLDKANHSRKPQIAALQTQIKNESEALGRIIRQLKSTPREQWPSTSMPLGKLLDLSRQGVALNAFDRFAEVDANAARATIENERKSIDPRTLALADHGFRGKPLEILGASSLSIESALMLKEKGIAITERSIDFALQLQDQGEEMKPFGKGKMNSTALVKIQGKEFVFKPTAAKEKGWVAYYSGIDLDNPKTLQRNLATCAIAKAMGFDVVASTKLGIGRPPPPPPNAPATLGMVMEKANGQSGLDAAQSGAFKSAQLRQQLLRLQLLDHIVAQGDRHCNNYLVEKTPSGEYRVLGIDNDQCLGKKITDPNDIHCDLDDDVQSGFRGTRLPPVVDMETAKLVRGLSSTALREILSDDFSEEEIEAAELRLSGVHAHIDRLEREGRLVSVGQLSDARVTAMFKPDNSYIGRELAASQIQFLAGVQP